MIAPFYWMLVGATHSTADVFANPPDLLPGGHLWKNLVGLFTEHNFGRSVLNSLAVSIGYLVLGGLVCVCGGYAFAKFTFRGRTAMFAVVIATLTFPHQVTLVPLFQTMVTLGWLNSYQALILPNLAYPFGLFLMRQAMSSVPDEIIHAARVDGAGELNILFRIVLPTVLPSVAALGIFLFLGIWNDFMWPLVVLRTPDAYTIPVTLASFQDIGTIDYGQLITATVISVLPVAALFLLLQRYFVAGLMAGAVKQ